MSNEIMGRIHSIESFGAVDGPGIRYVLFMQGCPLKCKYCHNPDSWSCHDGKMYSVNDIANDIKTYYNFIKNGGVTISGGEPLLQPEFLIELLNRCREMKLHTAIDTAGSLPLSSSKECIDAADMLLLDIKCIDDGVCRELTGMSNENALATLKYCEETQKPVWIRHVMVPGITLDTSLLTRLAEYLKDFKCIKNVELLPFHKMGEFKWESLNMNYELYDTVEPTKEEIASAKEIFTSRNLPVLH